jgi:hypothetical protein
MIVLILNWAARWWCYLLHCPWHDAEDWHPVGFADWERWVTCERCGRGWREGR